MSSYSLISPTWLSYIYIYICIYLSTCLSCLCIFCLFSYLSTYLPINRPACPFVQLAIYFPSISFSIYLATYLDLALYLSTDLLIDMAHLSLQKLPLHVFVCNSPGARRLPQNLCQALRKRCACHEICAPGKACSQTEDARRKSVHETIACACGGGIATSGKCGPLQVSVVSDVQTFSRH